jgi:NTP pyrophosphatase (non-canonical NTP hydrolase)
MWADDRLWLPQLLLGNPFSGRFVIKDNRIQEWHLQGAPHILGGRNSQNYNTLEELDRLIWQHLIDRDWNNPTARSLAISLSLEANELLEHYQWSEKAIGDTQALAEELADILIYALQYGHVLGVDPAQAIRDKLAKTARRYPAEQFKGKNETEKKAHWLTAKADYRKHKKGL